MELKFTNRFSASFTVVANEFIDEYMAAANGEYVKVYLYLLRHEGEAVTVEAVADALNHTEADVRRAFAYWQKAGVLEPPRGEEAGVSGAFGMPYRGEAKAPGREEAVCRTEERRAAASQPVPNQAARETSAACACDMEALSDDETFTQLVYISQKYLNKTFTPVDCQVFVNLYKNLKMAPELIEFLVEYCAQNGHTSLRYVEKVALNWHEKKIMTVEEARAYSRSFSKESFAVMKAMGLTGRNPADSEFELMEKWFKIYGFTREIVVEACDRTIRAIHSPSFQYADRILSDWKEAGVRTKSDIDALDKMRREQEKTKENKAGRGQAGSSGRSQKGGQGRSSNRFHNLEEHGYDYDEMVWDMINAGQKSGEPGEGHAE